jgi:hypothetical protein
MQLQKWKVVYKVTISFPIKEIQHREREFIILNNVSVRLHDGGIWLKCTPLVFFQRFKFNFNFSFSLKNWN